MKRTDVQLAGSFACKINLLSRDITAATSRLLARWDVTPSQASLLYFLMAGDVSPSTIAGKIGVDASNLSRMIRQFEERGLIVRHVDDENRRRVWLELTKEGKKLAKTIDPHAQIIQDAIESALNARELQVFARSLAKVSDAIRGLDAED